MQFLRLCESFASFEIHYEITCSHAITVSRTIRVEFSRLLGQAAGRIKMVVFRGFPLPWVLAIAEVGTVTPGGQSGNAKPRLFRYPDLGALVNRMGFNNKGSEALAEHISKFYPKGKRRSPSGNQHRQIKSTPLDQAVDDYLTAFTDAFLQADYIAINISSPNTPDLRNLHRENHLVPLLKEH